MPCVDFFYFAMLDIFRSFSVRHYNWVFPSAEFIRVPPDHSGKQRVVKNPPFANVSQQDTSMLSYCTVESLW